MTCTTLSWVTISLDFFTQGSSFPDKKNSFCLHAWMGGITSIWHRLFGIASLHFRRIICLKNWQMMVSRLDRIEDMLEMFRSDFHQLTRHLVIYVCSLNKRFVLAKLQHGNTWENPWNCDYRLYLLTFDIWFKLYFYFIDHNWQNGHNCSAELTSRILVTDINSSPSLRGTTAHDNTTVAHIRPIALRQCLSIWGSRKYFYSLLTKSKDGSRNIFESKIQSRPKNCR